jgi:hypothetical protein
MQALPRRKEMPMNLFNRIQIHGTCNVTAFMFVRKATVDDLEAGYAVIIMPLH